jgi:hypothetical protein
MKKVLLMLAAFAVALGSVSAQGNDDGKAKDPARFKPKYRNLSYSSQTVSYPGVSGFSETSRYGAAFTTGRSYIVHPNPIAGMLRIGIDATWFDLNYGNFSPEATGEGGAVQQHKMDIALGVGPGIHLNPVAKLGIHTYFRYNPTFTAMANIDGDNTTVTGGYATCFTGGAAVSWGVISLGFETRFGGGTLTRFGKSENADSLEEIGGIEDVISQSKVEHKLSGYRAYVSFRF